MKKRTATIVVIILFAVSAVIYFIQFKMFHDTRDTFFYLLQDWAFLPVQIAVVTIVVGMVTGEREKRERLARSKMLTVTFFSDLGTELLKKLMPCAENVADAAEALNVREDWDGKRFRRASASIKSMEFKVRCTPESLESIGGLLRQRKLDMLVMASNPALLEHEDFTDLLWAVFHLTDELAARERFDDMPPEDAAHLNEDVKRALTAVLVNWIAYMNNIRTEYPYLYSMALRKKPFAAELGIN